MSSRDPEKCSETRPEPSAPEAISIAESNSSEDPGTADALGRTLTAQVSRASARSSNYRVASVATTGTSDPQFEVDWESENDPAHPKNWSLRYRAMAVLFLSWNTLVV